MGFSCLPTILVFWIFIFGFRGQGLDSFFWLSAWVTGCRSSVYAVGFRVGLRLCLALASCRNVVLGCRVGGLGFCGSSSEQSYDAGV